MLCADGKKVTSGLDKTGGDVDMFGFEDGETLLHRTLRKDQEVEAFEKVKSSLILRTDSNPIEDPELTDNLKNCISILSKRNQECRELEVRQQFGLTKFTNLAGEKWRESKYV